MTPFFKKIRKKLIDESRLKRYLIYALGEIILVVIGILIAVQINNWNEARKSEEALNTILLTIKQDLENDLEEVEQISDFYQKKGDLIDTLLNHDVNIDYVRNCSLCPALTTGYSSVPFNTRGYDLLKNRIETSSVTNDSLLIDLGNFYRQKTLVSELIDEELKKETFKSLDHMRQYEDWFVDFIDGEGIPDAMNDYILNNKTHRTQMAFYRMLITRNYLPFLGRFEEAAKETIEEINQRIGIVKEN